MQAERIAQTVKLFPHKGRVPKTPAKNVAAYTALCLIQSLHNQAPEAPFGSSNKDTVDALEKLVSIYLQTSLTHRRKTIHQFHNMSEKMFNIQVWSPVTNPHLSCPGSRRNVQGCRTAMQKTNVTSHYYNVQYCYYDAKKSIYQPQPSHHYQTKRWK